MRSPEVVKIERRTITMLRGNGSNRRQVRVKRIYVHLKFGRTVKKLSIDSSAARWLEGKTKR